MPRLRYKPTGPIQRASSQGFTMIELVIALAIIAIIAGFATAGGTRNWLVERGLSTALEQLRGDMQRAKLLAIKRHANCTITLNAPADPANHRYTISLSNQTVNLRDYRGTVQFTGPLLGAGVATFTFTPWGTCTAGEIQLTNHANGSPAPIPANNDTHFYRLRTSASGGISKQVWSDTTATWVSAGV